MSDDQAFRVVTVPSSAVGPPPCPLCRGRAFPAQQEGAHWIHCINCGTHGPLGSTAKLAEAGWNRLCSRCNKAALAVALAESRELLEGDGDE